MGNLPQDIIPITARQAVDLSPTAWLSMDDDGNEVAAFIDGTYSYGGFQMPRAASPAERRQVREHLAVKYGIPIA